MEVDHEKAECAWDYRWCLVAAPISVNWPSEDHAVVTINSADAKVGKPLSATSVAGVNRRQGRREQRKGK
jgi:hypothetical protein